MHEALTLSSTQAYGWLTDCVYVRPILKLKIRHLSDSSLHMTSTILSSQKVPGTRAPSTSEQPTGNNFLAGFSFSYIGQQPSLLKRLSNDVSVDQHQEFQYPSSPSSSSAPNARVLGVVPKEPAPGVAAVRGPSSTCTFPNATLPRETSFTSTAASLSGYSLPEAVATVAGPSAQPTLSAKQNLETSCASQSNQRDSADPMNSAYALAREASLPHHVDTHTSFRPSPPNFARTTTHTRRQDVHRTLDTQEVSPTDLVARITRVASEKAEWGEMKHLMEQYRREHEELSRRNDESARAYQKEREQVSKVSAIADSAFSKLETLLLRQEERLASEQQQAESALTEAQGIITDRNARSTTGVEQEEARAAAEALRRQMAMEEERRVAEAAEEAQRRATLVETERERVKQELEAEKQRAEDEQRKVTEEERAAEEQRKADFEEEERCRVYAAQRAAALKEKRAYLEAQRREARQNQEKRTKPTKEEVKARLERERNEAASRSTSVSSTGPLVPMKAESEREPTMCSPPSGALAAGESAPFTLPAPVQSALLPKSATTPNPETQTGKTRGRGNNHASSPVDGKQVQPTNATTPTVAPAQSYIPQTAEGPQMSNQTRSEARTPKLTPMDDVQPDTATPRLPSAASPQAAPKASTSQQVSAKEDRDPSATRRSAQHSQATATAPTQLSQATAPTSAQRAIKPLRSSSSAKAGQASHHEQPVVKQEPSVDLRGLMVQTPQVSFIVSAVPSSVDVAAHGHTQNPQMNGDMRSQHAVPYPSSSNMKNTEQHRPAMAVPPAKDVSVPMSSSSSLPQRPVAAKASRNLGTFEVTSEADPWVNTPDVGEDNSHRRDDLQEDPPRVRHNYSPPRPVTPPGPPPARGYDHYSPHTEHPTRHDERSPVRRKRVRPNADTLPDNEPPAHRARLSPPNDIRDRRRVTAPEPRSQPMWPDYGDGRDRSPHDNGWSPTFDSGWSPAHDNGWSPVYDNGRSAPYDNGWSPSRPYSPPHLEVGSMYNERQTRPAALTTPYGPTSNPLPELPPRQPEQSKPLHARITEPPRSSLIDRMSDNTTHGRNAAPSTGRGRGRGKALRGGRQHRSPQS